MGKFCARVFDATVDRHSIGISTLGQAGERTEVGLRIRRWGCRQRFILRFWDVSCQHCERVSWKPNTPSKLPKSETERVDPFSFMASTTGERGVGMDKLLFLGTYWIP